MTAEHRIRPAAEADVPVLARMRRSLAEHLAACDPDLWELAPGYLARMAGFYAAQMSRENTRLFLALDAANAPTGMVMVRVLENAMLKPSRFGRIDDAWVEPGSRRQGVMRALVRAALEFIKTQGVRHVMLDYSVQNPISAAAWHRLGFRPALVTTQATVEQVQRRCR
jgi:ribosomal protein S18 acetylase RimI-like enzyme